jgi:hypothetical protein
VRVSYLCVQIISDGAPTKEPLEERDVWKLKQDASKLGMRTR